MPAESAWTYNYATIAKLTGQTKNTVQQHVARKRKEDPDYDLGDLKTAFLYLCEYGKLNLRRDGALIMLAGADKYREAHRGNKRAVKKKSRARKK